MSMGLTMNSCDAAVVTIACAVTFIVTLIFTAIITFTVTYIFVKKTLSNITQDVNHTTGEKPLATTNTIIYDEPVGPLSKKKDDLELQPNPAYGTSHEVVMDTNPAYESSK